MAKKVKEAAEQKALPAQTESVQEIAKATYNKSGVHIEYTEAKIIDGKAKVKEHSVSDPTPPHPDLIQSLKLLLPHFIRMTPLAFLFPELDSKYIKGRKVLDEPTDAKIFIFEVNGVSFSGVSDTPEYTVQLIGRLKYPNGKVISMTLPGERLNAEGGYSDKEQLAEDINNFIDEIDQFDKGKALQGKLDLVGEASNGNDER